MRIFGSHAHSRRTSGDAPHQRTHGHDEYRAHLTSGVEKQPANGCTTPLANGKIQGDVVPRRCKTTRGAAPRPPAESQRHQQRPGGVRPSRTSDGTLRRSVTPRLCTVKFLRDSHFNPPYITHCWRPAHWPHGMQHHPEGFDRSNGERRIYKQRFF